MLDSLGTSLRRSLLRIQGASSVDLNLVDQVVEELQEALISSDVNLELALNMGEKVREEVQNSLRNLPPGINRRDFTVKIIYDELTALLGKKYVPLKLDPSTKNIFMFVGIQGSGKTTSIGKVSNYLKKRGYNIGVIGGDTFRPGALDQLKQLLEPIGIEVYGEPNEKKAKKVIKNGLKHFKSKKSINVILIDTTGRHKEETSLLKEMGDISKSAKPTEIFLVIDATIGQQARNQADAFARKTPIGSIILTKMDGSAKGGGALSAVSVTGGVIRFYGDGEHISDFEEFNPTRFVGSLLGMGDIEGLVSRITESLDVDDQAELTAAIKKGKLTLRHFKIQLESASKQSSLGKIASKIPGISSMVPNTANLDSEGKENIKRFIAILNSMTDDELEDAKLIKRKRIDRIAKGSGTSPKEVKLLLKQFSQTTKAIKLMRKSRGGRRGGQGLPPGLEGMMG